MLPARAVSLLAYLAEVPDPRGRMGRRHPLAAMLTAIVCGLLCGARGYAGLVEWLHDQEVAAWHWMGFLRRPPKGDCFRDLLMKLDPSSLEAVLSRWKRQHSRLRPFQEPPVGVSFDDGALTTARQGFFLDAATNEAIRISCPRSKRLIEDRAKYRSMNEYESLELLLATHHFPGPYMFKVIGRDVDGFQARVMEAIRNALHIQQDPPFRTQPSSGGKHVSITLEPHVFEPAEVITVYRHLRETEGVLMVM